MYFAHLLPPTRLAAIIDERIAQCGAGSGRGRSLLRFKRCACESGMRFAAGYGRAVIGAALAYVRANKAGLVQEVAAAADPERLASAGELRVVSKSAHRIAGARTSPAAPAGRLVE